MSFEELGFDLSLPWARMAALAHQLPPSAAADWMFYCYCEITANDCNVNQALYGPR